MKSIKNYVAGSAVLVILALVFALAHSSVPRAVADEFKDVRVINAESMPAQVRDVDNPGRQPVHFNESYTVPAGKASRHRVCGQGLSKALTSARS
jgi:hypothetical protein